MCSCIEGLAKWFLIATNSLTFVAALVVLGISVWILVDQPSFLKVLNLTDDVIGGLDIKVYQSATIVLLVLAILVIIITFFGCCGAQNESKCLLWTYFILDVLLLIGAGVGAYFVFTGHLDKLKSPFIAALKEYNPDSSHNDDQTLVTAWDQFQQDFKCCGVSDWHDWGKYNPHFSRDAERLEPKRPSTSRPTFSPRSPSANDSPQPHVPESCCSGTGSSKPNCARDPQSSKGLYATGCFQMVVNEIEKHEAIIGGIAIVVVAVMVLNAIISIYMATCGYYDPNPRPNYQYQRPAYQ